MANQSHAPGVRPIPTEDAGLTPESERGRALDAARIDRKFNPKRGVRPYRMTNPVMPPRELIHATTEISKLGSETHSAAIVRGKCCQTPAGSKHPQGLPQHISAVQDAGRSRYGKRCEGTVGIILDAKSTGYQRRKLNSRRFERRQIGIRQSVSTNQYSRIPQIMKLDL